MFPVLYSKPLLVIYFKYSSVNMSIPNSKSIPSCPLFPAGNCKFILLSFWACFCFVVAQSPSHVWLFTTHRTAALQASLSLTLSWSLPKFMSIELMMPNYLILCCPLLLLPSVFPSIGVVSNESAVCIRWPKYWSFSLSISPSNGKYYPSSIAIKNWLLLETLLNYWWEHKLVQPVGENSMESLKN